MATANEAERNARGDDFAARYATATLQIRQSTTVLVTHTFAGFAAAAGGVITANAIADATNAATGTADNAVLSVGGQQYDLTVGTSGTDVVVSNTSYVAGGTSSINSATVTFPAS